MNEIVEVPERFVELLLEPYQPPAVASRDGSDGGEDRAAPGEPGAIGEEHGAEEVPLVAGRSQLKDGITIGVLSDAGEPGAAQWEVGAGQQLGTQRVGSGAALDGPGPGADGVDQGFGAMGVSLDWKGTGEEGDGSEEGPPGVADDGPNVRPNLRDDVPMVDPAEDARSTFAVDVDTASYTRARQQLRSGRLPSPDEVRIEEFINARSYDLPEPAAGDVVSITTELTAHPWAPGRRLLRVSLKTAAPPPVLEQTAPMRLVFLVDVSGSMSSSDKLPMARQMLHELVDALPADTEVALVTYAAGSEQLLPLTPLRDRARLHDAIDRLDSGGGTGMAEGLLTAYALLGEAAGPGERRVMLVTDGDANVGPRSAEEMLAIIDGQRRAAGITLTGLGFGARGYSDRTLEALTNAGDGGYFFIDSAAHARELFVSGDIRRVLRTAARDARVQVHFSPQTVTGYRLLGYENRDVADDDFRSDEIDAGEMGQSQQVTALYELDLSGQPGQLAAVQVRAWAEDQGAVVEQHATVRDDMLRRELSLDSRAALAAAALAGRLRGDRWAAEVGFAQIAALGDEETAELADTAAALWEAAEAL